LCRNGRQADQDEGKEDMPVPTVKKAATIDELTDKLARVSAAALIEYRGLTVKEISNLRTDLRKRNVELQVTKNTLLRQAAHRNHMLDLDHLFEGPTAVAFIYEDEAAGTKALNDYFRTARVGQIKAGLLRGGRGLTAEQFTKLADLPSREVLLAQIAGLFNGPLSQMASLLNAPMQQFAYALGAFEEKGGAGVQTGAGAVAVAETPAAAPEAAPEAVSAGPATPEPPSATVGAAEAVAPDQPAVQSAGDIGGAPAAAPEVAAEPATASAAVGEVSAAAPEAVAPTEPIGPVAGDALAVAADIAATAEPVAPSVGGAAGATPEVVAAAEPVAPSSGAPAAAAEVAVPDQPAAPAAEAPPTVEPAGDEPPAE
jgi:large subunit ribosomal protein L10